MRASVGPVVGWDARTGPTSLSVLPCEQLCPENAGDARKRRIENIQGYVGARARTEDAEWVCYTVSQ